jgi:SAM-dependent methyltransferase
MVRDDVVTKLRQLLDLIYDALPPRPMPIAQPGQETTATGSRFDERAVAVALFRGALHREPDPVGLAGLVEFLRAGNPLEDAVRGIVTSAEFQLRAVKDILPPVVLPDLKQLIPANYTTKTTPSGDEISVFKAEADEDFVLLEQLIVQHGYYDLPGVWGAKIDLDKRVTAAIVRGLGARSCLEIGCFTGAVLSLLARDGLAVAGVDASHLAFVLAYPEIRGCMIFGDLLTAEIGRRFDVVLGMDIFEHFSPVRLQGYIAKAASLVAEDGYVLVNSPMFGADDVFGTVFPVYLEEWHSVGDRTFWRQLDCDPLGWPKHGHLVWASPRWWERQFDACGLVRDRAVEAAIQRRLAKFFEVAPGRKCLFVLKPPTNRRPPSEVARMVEQQLDSIEDLPR